MKTEDLLKKRYNKRFGDKWDRTAKLFDYYDMIDFAKQYETSRLEALGERKPCSTQTSNMLHKYYYRYCEYKYCPTCGVELPEPPKNK